LAMIPQLFWVDKTIRA